MWFQALSANVGRIFPGSSPTPDATLAATVPLRALDAAVRRRRPEAGLMHHSNRGCQYTSTDYRSGSPRSASRSA